MGYYQREESVFKIYKEIIGRYFNRTLLLKSTPKEARTISKYSSIELEKIGEYLKEHDIEHWDTVTGRDLVIVINQKKYKAVAHFTKDKLLYAINCSCGDEKFTLKRIVNVEKQIIAVKNLIDNNSKELLLFDEKSTTKNDYVFWNLSVHSFFGPEVKLFVEPLIEFGFKEVIPKVNGVLLKS